MSRFDRKRRRKATKTVAVPVTSSMTKAKPAEKPVFLSGCVIVRDGAQDIAWCLESFVDEVDELIVVDTGSQDATKEIARRYTPHVYDFAWRDDFAAAKNFALSKAHGKWAFFPDSDERLSDASRGGKVRKAAQMADEQGADALELIRHEIDLAGQSIGLPDNPAVRMMKVLPDLQYQDPIHEYLAYPDHHHVPIARILANDILLLHRGYAPERQAAKTARNLALLEKMEREGAEKPFLHFYLSGIYISAGRWEDAAREAKQSLAEGEHPATGAIDVWRNWQTAAERLGDPVRLREVCERTVREAPQLPDSYLRLAVLAMLEGDYAKAEPMLLEAQQRQAVFAKACPNDYDTFGAALPKVAQLLEDCRKELGGRPAPDSMPEQEASEGRKADVMVEAADAEEDGDGMKEEKERGEGLSALLPPSAKMVLEFGCGIGENGEDFLRRQPECRYYGVTHRQADVAGAARVLTGACVGTAETVDLARTGLREFDCIAYGPEDAASVSAETLRVHAELLSEQGQMVFVLRNPSYFRDVLARFAGQSVPETGCRTLQELATLLREAGMETIFAIPQYEPGEKELAKDAETGTIFQQLQAWGAAHGCPEGRADVWARSYVVRASRKKVPNIFVQTIIGESTVTARMRVWEPDNFLRTEPGWILQSSLTKLQSVPKQMQGSIVVRQRRGYVDTDEATRTTKFLREHYDIVLYEIDDNPILWQKKNIDSAYMDYRGAHAVQVSTPALAEVVRKYNPHVFVVENHLKELPAPRDYIAEERTRQGRVTIFFGALNRERDWQDILPAINRAAKTYAGKVYFRVLADKLFYQALETQDKEYVGDPKQYDGKFVPFSVYEDVLHSADISLLPLHDSEFNRTKSDLKFIESAGHGAVVLASPTVYERTVVDGCTGCIYHTPEEFEAKLTRLIEDGAYRHAIAAAAYQYVKEHRLMSQHYLERAKIYEGLLAHKEELDRELEQRIAGVGD